jgi:hypothetical protein
VEEAEDQEVLEVHREVAASVAASVVALVEEDSLAEVLAVAGNSLIYIINKAPILGLYFYFSLI